AVIIPSDTHHAQAAASGSPWSSGIGWCETLNMVLRSLLLAEVLTNALDAIRIVMITLAVEKGIDHRVGQHRPTISLFPIEALFPIEPHDEHEHDEGGDGAEDGEEECRSKPCVSRWISAWDSANRDSASRARFCHSSAQILTCLASSTEARSEELFSCACAPVRSSAGFASDTETLTLRRTRRINKIA